MTQPGDRGLVFAAGSPLASFSTVDPAAVGDMVILYNLGNGQQLAVPILNLQLGHYTWTTPDFQFAGFNWNLPFNFQLLPLGFLIGGTGTLVYAEDWGPVPITGAVLTAKFSHVKWNGAGHVYLSRSPSAVQSIRWDDELKITTQLGGFDWYNSPYRLYIPAGNVSDEVIDITSYLAAGDNTLTIQIRDVYGLYYGAYSNFYAIQTIP